MEQSPGMSTITFGDAPDQSGDEPRQLWQSIGRGARCRCPACGEGRIFAGFLTTRPACENCGERLDHHRADDLPAYLNILVTGHVVVGAAMVGMDATSLPIWAVTSLSGAAALAMSALTMRPLKGMVVAAQWALRMHGFGGHED